MRLLVDVCLSEVITKELVAAGYPARHWSEIGDSKAKDTAILEWAGANDHVIITADTDFSHLLVMRRLDGPSTIILRTLHHGPKHVLPLVLDALRRFAPELRDGCLIALTEERARIRRLPIQ